MIGQIATYIVLLLAALATVFYFLSGKKDTFTKPAEYSYFGLLAGLVFISAYLMANILTYNFSFAYIWEYSSKELPFYLLITSFYSGQEGSFLLWALFLALFGIVVQPYAKKHGYQSLVMGFYSFILVFIVLLLISKSPFKYVWDAFADQGIAPGHVPENGRGLNPILQNYWNAIHPPMLFIGYAAMTVPFVFALAGLIKKEFHEWINIALPWTLAASALLGLGIMLGAFWAYETLGWGGFWGWDPVENSSLIPWLTSVALIHTMLVQRKTKGLIRTNFALAIISFVLVLYATFLTRSGILGDISVHSFGEPGKLVYTLLMGFQITFTLIAVWVFIIRFKDISKAASNSSFKPSSREFMMSIGAIVILALTTIVFLGTSWPIFTELFSATKSSVDMAFYNKWSIPFAILIMVLNALSLYMSWKESNFKKVLNTSIFAISFALTMTVVTFMLGVSQGEYLVLALCSYFSVYVNCDRIFRVLLKKPTSTGAFISHFGLSLLILGSLFSGAYSESEHVTLTKGKSKDVLGYKVSFTDKIQIEKELQDREKYQYIIKVEKDGTTTELKPVFYWSDFNGRQAPFLEPGIAPRLLSDIYISPKTAQTSLNVPTALLEKFETQNIPGDTANKVTLDGFDMSQGMTMQESRRVLLGVNVTYNIAGKEIKDTLYCQMSMETLMGDPIMKQVPGTSYKAGFSELIRSTGMGGSQAAIVFIDETKPIPQAEEIFTFDLAIKPFINFVWIGTFFSILGFIIAIFKHNKKRKMEAA